MKLVTSYQKKRTSLSMLVLLITLLNCVVNPFTVNAQSYSGPLVITKGGTYSGNWESKDTEVPAVEIRTSEPVIITNSNIRGAGYLIKSWGYAANITVRNTKGYGGTPTAYKGYIKTRRFLTVNNFKNVVVENCYLEGTSGIYIGTRYEGNGSTSETIKIRFNKVKNIDGRVFNGAREHSQFVQFNFRNAIRHAEISWNEVINEPNSSLVEDNINMYNTQGVAGSPIKIHNNYIQGAYPFPANAVKYSGGGIITDGDGGLDSAPAHIEGYENILVGLGNYNMQIAGGNNINFHHNRAINAAMFADGTRYMNYTTSFACTDYYKKGTTFNNTMAYNVIGVTGQTGTWNNNTIYNTGNAKLVDNTYITGTITRQMEADEYSRWTNKLRSNNVVLGPNGSAPVATTPAPQPTPTPAPVAEVKNPTSGGTAATGSTTATGKITREYWSNVHGNSINVVPSSNPSNTSELTLFEAPTNVGDNYGQRIRGYVTAPTTGDYIFWIAADDMAELYLSSSEDPAKKKRIAHASDWTNSREWTKHAGQQSAKIRLEAGKRYYIEAVHLERGGGDNLAVGWQLPNGAQERPIASSRLSPMGSTAAPSTATATQPATPATTTGSSATATGKVTREYWSNVHGNSINVVPSSNPSNTSELTLFEAPTNVGDNYGQRIRGYVTAPTTGDYIFWIAADDMAELYLSSSEDPAKKKRIAHASDWTNSREWTKHAGQQSAKIRLEAGKRYYIEAVHLERGGGDNLAVGWQLPNGAQERPIAGNRLSPVGSLTATVASKSVIESEEFDPYFSEVTAYPNPFKDVVTVDFGATEVKLTSIVIMDQTGKVVYKQDNNFSFENNKVELNLANTNLPAGLYILKYTDAAGHSSSQKIMKQ
ncbi:PA14 domain-containing protein [Pontibacter sp. SGAir0037]|uniref:PA14 domain-containing protein n=1 Tax=Pontibacter sp. SGAir0037 TaxID=2571030 RepID=UPI0010CCF939|nr:PA14 domain-containing protein [Pontibacter sp. SGAir0037]QCR22818.1 hypothetical protein C1N53_11010 [Pontibacter sp. SGAir0037]